MNNTTTYREVLNIAIPMILAMSSIPLLGLVDTTLVGHFKNPSYLSAVEIGDTVFGFIYMLFSFLRLSIIGMTAQAMGRENKEELIVILMQGLFIGIGIGCILACLPKGLLNYFMSFINSESSVQQLSTDYLRIRLFSAPAALGNLVIASFLLGMRKPAFSMRILLIINGIAIFLDIFFISILNMGVKGISSAILIGQIIGFCIGLLTTYHVLNLKINDIIFNFAKYLKLGFERFLNINKNLLIRSICFIIVYSVFLEASSQMGTIILAANSILLVFYSFISLGLEGFANATEVLVGKAVGRQDKELLNKSISISVSCSFLAALSITLIYSIFGKMIVAFITNLPEMQTITDQYLIWICMLPIICVCCYLLDAIFLGFMQVCAMRNSLIIATFLFFIPIYFLTKSFGNHGLWLSLFSFFLARSGVLAFSMFYKKNSILENPLMT